MYQENVVLCGASAYEQKYYFNQDFDSLPESVKQELHIMCSNPEGNCTAAFFPRYHSRQRILL